MKLLAKTSSHLSSISSSPLVSSIITIYALILLYFPYQIFLRIVFSPVLIITGVLLLYLLRLGAIQSQEDEKKEEEKPCQEQGEIEENPESKESNSAESESISGLADYDQNWVSYQSDTDSESEMDLDPNPCFEDSFWNLRGPLEVIYEEYEGEEEDDPNEKDPNPNQKEGNRVVGIERYPSRSRYYPDSDSDNSSDGESTAEGFWGSPEKMCFRWEEDDREGLIEIALDGNKRSRLDFRVEEENFIEIDISSRNDELPARNGGPTAS
ncbi:hypothetical protein UlMin_011751 [Ulmus minor]